MNTRGKLYPIHNPSRRLTVAGDYPWWAPTEFLWETTENYIGLVAALPWPVSVRIQQPHVVVWGDRFITYAKIVAAAGFNSVWSVYYGLTDDGLSNYLRWNIQPLVIGPPTVKVFNEDVTFTPQSLGLWLPDQGYLVDGATWLCPTGVVNVQPIEWDVVPPPQDSAPW